MPPSKVSFGLFEADLKTGELRKSGIRVKIQGQPFRVLTMLLERPGEVVTREELQKLLWGTDTTVDFDHSLGTAINKIREAIGDSADNPRFIETLAKRGYRFIAPVSVIDVAVKQPESLIAGESLSGPKRISTQLSEKDQVSRWLWLPSKQLLISAAIVLVASYAAWAWVDSRPPVVPAKVSQVTFSGRLSPGEPLLESLPGTATDGSRLYFLQIRSGRAVLSQALIADGESSVLALPSEIEAPSLGDISPDGSKLLVRNHLAPEAEQALWIVPTTGGGARRLANALGHDGTWMPDGKRILIATGNDLLIAKEDGTETIKFATLPGRAFWLRWSPDGGRLRFTLLDSKDHTTSLWEIAADGSKIHQIMSGWNNPQMECCGAWTADGKYYIFQATRNGLTSIWGLTERFSFFGPRSSTPWQITDGPLNYQAPIPAKTGHNIFFIGLDTRYELLRYEAATQQFLPFGKNLVGVGRTEFSRDGQWVAWVRPGDGSLWRSRSDGSGRLQLTESPLQVFMVHWSPDNQRIALMGREPGKPWKIYVVPATGGTPQLLRDEDRNQADPDWSPDGKSIVFGRLPELMAEGSSPKAIYIENLDTKQLSTVPGSQGLFSPRWSPDGRYISAMPLEQNKLLLFDTVTQTWRTLAEKNNADPVWSRDGKWIYFHDFIDEGEPLYRVNVQDGKLEQVAGLGNFQSTDAVDFSFSGLAPGDVPLVRARMWTANLYTLDLDGR